MFEDRKADRTLGLFRQLTAQGMRGLCVSRIHPDHLRDDYGITSEQVIWLSNTAGQRNVNPQNISILTDMLVHFFDRGPEAVVGFEGVEYLVLQNDFARVLRLVNYLYETTAVTQNILMMTLDPRAFNPRELAYLEKDAEIVKEDQPLPGTEPTE